MGSPPTSSNRVTSTLHRMGDGWQTLVSCILDNNIEFWEKDITPPGVDGLAASETATMHNLVWRTMHSRRLKTLTPCNITAQWNPSLYVDVLNVVNINTSWTIHFPTGDKLAFYAFLQSFKPSALSDGKVPECTVELTPTNADPTDCSEQGPLFIAGSGTAPC